VTLANLVVVAALNGLIWTIQLVHYPLFALVGGEQWPRYEAGHQRRITWVVLPLMSLAVALSVALLVAHPGVLAWSNAVIAVGQFVATGLFYAPLHGELARGFSTDRIQALVRLNWLRTAGWTVQLAVAVALAAG
jgi:hypothetical protein